MDSVGLAPPKAGKVQILEGVAQAWRKVGAVLGLGCQIRRPCHPGSGLEGACTRSHNSPQAKMQIPLSQGQR